MLSYSRGPDKPLWEYTIGQVLDRAVERWGDCLGLVSCHQPLRYSWRELRQAADAVASFRRSEPPGLAKNHKPTVAAASAKIAHELKISAAS